MLKIKDNVDLKELEKYGFEYNKYYLGYAKTICYGRRGQQFDLIFYDDRILLGYAEGADGDGAEGIIDDTIYNLIKADLVEKVESDE